MEKVNLFLRFFPRQWWGREQQKIRHFSMALAIYTSKFAFFKSGCYSCFFENNHASMLSPLQRRGGNCQELGIFQGR
ncbi:MAG: hypothetical protein LBR79_06780 [Oscillospiraceae bacterium]|nr:hypothetical protein [Oscillospiraceae bacterium]